MIRPVSWLRVWRTANIRPVVALAASSAAANPPARPNLSAGLTRRQFSLSPACFAADQAAEPKSPLSPASDVSSVSDILAFLAAKDTSSSLPWQLALDACWALNALASAVKSGRGSLDPSDPTFKSLATWLEDVEAVRKLKIYHLLNAFTGWHSLNLPAEHFAALNLENALLWLTRDATDGEVANVLRAAARFRGEGRPAEPLFQEACRTVKRRWVNMGGHPGTFITVMDNADAFEEPILAKMEDRLLEEAEYIDKNRLVMVLSKLGEKRRRNLPLIRSIAFHIAHGDGKLTPSQISNGLLAAAQLSFYDVPLLNYLCQSLDSDALNKLSSSHVPRSVLKSLGQLRFLSPKLMDDICQWMTSKIGSELLKSWDLVSFLNATAALNYMPNNSEELFQHVSNTLTLESIESVDKKELLWLNIVWSLVVHGLHKEHHLASILAQEFHNKLIYQHNAIMMIKLLNINAVAQYLSPGYKGPTICVKEDPLLSNLQCPPSEVKMKLASLTVEALSSLVSPPTHLVVGVNTKMGFNCDAECVMDTQQLRPIAVRKAESAESTNSGITGQGNLHMQPMLLAEMDDKCLSGNAVRVGLLVTSFHDYMVNNQSAMTGFLSLNKRLLESRGYKVLVINHTDFKEAPKNVEKVKIIEDKLKALLQQD